MMSPDHIWESPIWPAGRSLYMVMVTFGDVAATIAVICSPIIFRSSGFDVLTSVLPGPQQRHAPSRCASRR